MYFLGYVPQQLLHFEIYKQMSRAFLTEAYFRYVPCLLGLTHDLQADYNDLDHGISI